MSQLGRNSSPENILNPVRTFFVTTKTSMSRGLLQSERNATLLIDVLRSLVAEKHFHLVDFVIMPDHFHAVITVHDAMTIEKGMQLIKGRFPRRLKLETGYAGEIWQRGFSEIQVMNSEALQKYRDYIAANPVKANLAVSAEESPFCFASRAQKKAAGAEAQIN